MAGLPVPRRAWARSTIELGPMRIDTLSDGNLVLPGEFVFGPAPKDGLAEVLAAFPDVDRERLTPPCNVTMMRDGERTVLFDVGAGPAFQPSAGELPAALEALGVSPDEVTHVVFTHGHPDHLWGLLDDFDDPLFPEAEHMMGRAEFEFWRDPGTVDAIGEARAAFAVGAARRLEAIEDAVTLFGDGEEILPGVASVLTPGHTPGHMAFELRSGSNAAMVIGDAVANHHVAFARPEWPSGADQDPKLGATTRVMLLDRLASEDMSLVGFHLPGGGAGRAERAGGGYRFVSDAA